MSILQKIGDVVKWPGRRISEQIAQEVADKATVGLRAGLVELDRLAPIITDVIAGRKVKLHTVTEVWIEENEVDTK